jgi:DNA-binding MarR family transcriptional regulator
MTLIPDNETVLAFLAEHPGSKNTEVIDGTDLGPERALMALRRLERAEQITKVSEDPWRWSVAEEAP